MLAHAVNPDLVGRPASEAVGPNNYPAGEAIVTTADEDGEWFSYTFTNPVTGRVEAKHSWSVEHDGLTFGSGWYEPGPMKSDNPAYTRAFVQSAINLYNAVGLDATVAYYNTEESVDGQWYVFIGEGEALAAHAVNPGLVGRPASEAVGPNSYPAGEALAAAADEDGEWFSYTFTNPATGGVETKHSWVVEHDGLLFGSGWYEPGPMKSDNPAYTQAFVQSAINLYNAVGRDATVAYYNSEESVDGQWYVFIIGAEDGVTISHYNPSFIGRDPALRIDATGRFYGDDLLSATEAGKWVNYVIRNPGSGEEEMKHTWAVKHDGLLFGSGWYEPSQ